MKVRTDTTLQLLLRRLGANIGVLLTATSAAMFLGFLTVALNSRILGPEGIGILAMFNASGALLAGIFNVGSQQPLIRLGHEALEHGDREKVGIIASVALQLDILSSASAGTLALILVWLLPDIIGLKPEYQVAAAIYTLVVFSSATASANGIFRLFDRFWVIGAFEVFQAALILGLAGILALLEMAIPVYVVCYTFVYTFVNLTKVIVGIRILKRQSILLRFGIVAARKNDVWREYFEYAWTTFGTSLLNTIRQQADILMLGAIATPASVGIYAVVKQVIGVFNKVAQSFYTAGFPELAKLHAKRDVGTSMRLLNRFLFSMMAGGVILMVASEFLGETVLRYGFGPQFSAGALTLTLLLGAAILAMTAGGLSMLVQVWISPLRLLRVFVVASIGYAVVAPAAIYLYGPAGAAMGQIVFAGLLLVACWLALTPIFRLERSHLEPRGDAVPESKIVTKLLKEGKID